MRDDLTAAVDILARSTHIELESKGEPGAPLLTENSRELLEEFDTLERRYGRYWPPACAHSPDERSEPQAMLDNALQRLREWSASASGLVDRLEELDQQRDDLLLLKEIFEDAAESLPDLEQLTGAGPMIKTVLYLLPADEWPSVVPGTLITQRLRTRQHQFLLAIGLPDDIATLEQQLHVQKARLIRLPAELPAAPEAAAERVARALAAADSDLQLAKSELDALHERCDIADAIADVGVVRWYFDNVPDLTSTENFAWVTGWTSAPGEETLLRLLAEADIKALLRLAEPPGGFDPPLLLDNPRWMRPFELFTAMLGVPAAAAADPTRIVAIAGPLMFGFMFGDVGHGTVLLLVGLTLGRRLPALRLLVTGGAMSIVFGFLFGSVFALEQLIDPLWLRPMERPILMLLVPMLAGAVLLLIGMSLDALQAHWQHQGRYWWETGAGLVLSYLGLLGALLEPRLLWLAALGALWFVVGHAVVAQEGRFAAVGGAVAEFIETLLQLVVNTISFVRVGAFALAHAGLSLAVVGVAAAPDALPGKLLVLIFGNALIIGLEGLVVGIQTTRLVLFEFFVRFLRAEGRPFKPVVPHTTVSPHD